MRVLSRLLAVFIFCLVTIGLPAAPAQAADGAPYIILSPSSGVPGINVTVRGYNFTAGDYVDIYYCLNPSCSSTGRTWVADVETDEDGDFIVDFAVPESYTGAHQVRAYIDSALQTTSNFTVKAGLTVSPGEGPVGTNVTVEGHGFAKNETGIELMYYLNGNSEIEAQSIKADGDGWWQNSFVIPLSGKGSHKIDAQGNTTTLAAVKDAFFEVTPRITLDKSSGSAGENITMTGSGFAAGERDITILFSEQPVRTEIRADDKGYWEEDFAVPEMAKGAYNVTADGESTRKQDLVALSFAIKPGIVLSPTAGHVGTNLTVTGGGFGISQDVVIVYDGSHNTTAVTDNKGSFEASFPVPESQHGGRQVTAADVARNNATAIFTMESTPPGTPEPESPADGSRVGFIGKVRPTFNWSAVSDESGVRYSLQIAASANITAAGFANPIVSVTGIVGTDYTLNATQALPYGAYYWIVRAVDRADNAGDWTAARSFSAGVLPLWAFIAAIVAVVVLILGLVYFLVIRRRTHYYY